MELLACWVRALSALSLLKHSPGGHKSGRFSTVSETHEVLCKKCPIIRFLYVYRSLKANPSRVRERRLLNLTLAESQECKADCAQ